VDCREAFEFCRSVFRGEFEIYQTFGAGPPDMDVPDDERDNIMYLCYRAMAPHDAH